MGSKKSSKDKKQTKKNLAGTSSGYQPEISPKSESDIVVSPVEFTIVPFDENLLERSRTQWQFGDWQSLAQLGRDTLQHHPDRAKLALLAAAGRLQTGNDIEAKQFIRLAKDWGISRNLIIQILTAGVHNSLGRAAAIGNQQRRAFKHFEDAILISSSRGDSNLLAQARSDYQLNQLGLLTLKSHSIKNSGEATNRSLSLVVPESINKLQARKRLSREAIITGIPRSGTSLFSAMINKIEGSVCLNEILYNVSTLADDFCGIRRRLIAGKSIQNKYNENGDIATDTMENFTVKDVCLPKQKQDVIIASKVNVPYLFQIEDILKLCVPVFALVRDPVFTIASWSSNRASSIPEAKVGPSPFEFHKRWQRVCFKTNNPISRRAELWNFLAGILLNNIMNINIIHYEFLISDPIKAIANFSRCFGKPPLKQWEKKFDGNQVKRFPEVDIEEIRSAVRLYAPNRIYLGYGE